MPNSLRWIIVLAMGWEPEEDRKADFVYEILEINKPSINVDGFSYIPEQYIKEANAESLSELLNAEGVFACCIGSPYLQADSIVSYVGVEMAQLFEFRNYQMLYDNYRIDDLEGYIVWLYEQDASTLQPRRMVQQIKQSADKPGLPRMQKPQTLIPGKKIVTFGKTSTGPLTPTEYPESRFKKTRTRLPAFPPTQVDRDYMPMEQTQQRMKPPAPSGAKMPPTLQSPPANASEWENFLEDLDSELSDGTEKALPLSTPMQTIKREAPPALQHKPGQMEKAPKIAGPKRTKAVPEMYMSIQQEQKQDSTRKEYSEWNDFLGGLDAEVSNEGEAEQLATPGNIQNYRPESVAAENPEEETHSKSYKGRGLIPSAEDITLENAFKKYGQRGRGDHEKKTPSSKTPTPMMPDIGTKKIIARHPEQISKLTPTIQRKTPPAPSTFVHNLGGTPTPIFGLAGRPHSQPTPHPIIGSPPGHGYIPRAELPPVTPTATQSPIVTPSPAYKKHVTPPPISSNAYSNSDQIKTKIPAKKSRKKRKSLLARVASFFLFIILLVGGGGYAWYINGGKPFIDPYLVKSRQIWLQVREKVTGEKGPDAQKFAQLQQEYEQITGQQRKQPVKLEDIEHLDKFITKLPGTPAYASLVEQAKRQRQQTLENIRISLKKDISQRLDQKDFVRALQIVNHSKVLSELNSFCTLQQKAIENAAENTLDKSLKQAREKILKRDFITAIEQLEIVNKNQVPELKKQLEKQKGRLLHVFVTQCRDNNQHLSGIKYLYRFLLKYRQVDHDMLKTQDYIIWLIHHQMLVYTRQHNYDQAGKTIEKYQRIKLNKISSQVKQFLTENGAEKEWWGWLWQGVSKLTKERRVIRFELYNDVNAFQAKIVDFRPPEIRLWTAQKRFILKIDSLSWNSLEEILKYAKINISEQERAYRLGLFLFSQKRIEEARTQFIKAGKILLFKDKLKYYE